MRPTVTARRFLVAVAVLAGSTLVAPAPSAGAAPDPTRGQARVVLDVAAGQAPTLRTYHSQGGRASVAHTGAADWTVHIDGFTALGGNVQLTQYVDTGATMDRAGYCAIERWSPDATGTNVRIGCWREDGSAATDFAVGVLFDNADSFSTAAPYAAFWQGSGNWTGTIAPSPTYTMNATPRLTRTSVGHYTVEYLGGMANPFPLVTAWSSVPRVCNIVDWQMGRSTIVVGAQSQFVRVACFDFAGTAADTGFSFLLTDHSPLGQAGTTGGRVITATSPTGSYVVPASGNVNNTGGSDQATNLFRNIAALPPVATEVVVPGYTGSTFFVDAADTLESLGDDGVRCFLENAPAQHNGYASLFAFCRDRGKWVIHRFHAGIWQLA